MPPTSMKAAMANKPHKSRKRHTSGHLQRAHGKDPHSSGQRPPIAVNNGNRTGARPEVTKCACQFPKNGPSLLPDNAAVAVTLLVTFVTMVMRVYYVTLDTSWWILHPDEIYQSLEVAHSEFYGYGFRTYEYLAPANDGNLSLYQQKEQQVGMHALRSPLYPRFYVLVSGLVELLGSTDTPCVVWQIAHVIVSSLLPLAAHLFATSVFQSHDVGAISAALVASSVHLAVMGTHTLVHSFLAPAIFFSLSGLMPLLQGHLAACLCHVRRCSVEGLALFSTPRTSRYARPKRCRSGDDSPVFWTQETRRAPRHTKYCPREECALPETHKARDACLNNCSSVDGSPVFSTHNNTYDSERDNCVKGSRQELSSNDPCLHGNTPQNIKQTPTSAQNSHRETTSLTTSIPQERSVSSREASEEMPGSSVCDGVLLSASSPSLALISPGKFFEKVLNIVRRYSSGSNNTFVLFPSLGETRRDAIVSNPERNNALSTSEPPQDAVPGSLHNSRVSNIENGGLAHDASEVTPTETRNDIAKEREKVKTSSDFDQQNARSFRPLKVGVSSFVLAASCYIRPDTVLLACAVFAPYCSPHILTKIIRHDHFSQHVVLVALGAALGFGLGVTDDFYFYGTGVFSPLNWLKFNVLSNATSHLFGTQSASFYLHEVILDNVGMVVLAGLNVTGVLIEAAPSLKRDAGASAQRKSWVFRKAGLLASVVCLLGLFSLQQHKELRFVHHVIVLYLVLSAANVWSIATTITKTFAHIVPSRASTALFLLLFAYSQWTVFPAAHRPGDLKKWVYENNAENYDVTKCLNFIAAQNDVRGVFFDKNANLIGGYAFLRHKVPILTLTNTGYHEYAFSSWTRLDRKLCLRNSDSMSVVTVSKISNMFLAENSHCLFRHLLAHKEYNYLVLKTSTEFLNVGYKQVFRSESTKVLKRIGTREEEKRLSRVLPTLMFEPEAGVLQREARQLYAFGLEELASARYKKAIQRR